jgi:predicted lipid-binding transport protein (Tim44 family)
MAADAKKAAKAGKGAKAKKDPKAAKGAAQESPGAPSVAAHPRAARAVGRAKGWGALIGFLLGGYLSLPTNTLAAAGLRALAGGVVCYIAVWAGAVFLWRRLVMLEIKGREQRLIGAVRAASARRQLPSPPERPNARTS